MKEMPGKDEMILVHRYLTGQLNAGERELFEVRLKTELELAALLASARQAWEAATDYAVPHFDTTPALSGFRQTIKRRKSRKLTLTISAVAAVALVLVGIGSLFLGSGPGTSRAIYADQVMTMALEDGSEIVLRNGSLIRLADHFGARERRLEIVHGEVSFDVASDDDRPFVVSQPWAEVRVTGTEFVVAVDTASSTYVLKVTEGEVLFTPELSKQSIPVSAGSGIQFDAESRVVNRLRDIDENALSWQTGMLEFQNAPVDKVIRDLEAHYRIAITLSDPQLRTCSFTAGLPYRDVPVTDILNALATTFGLTVKQNSSGAYQLIGGRCR